MNKKQERKYHYQERTVGRKSRPNTDLNNLADFSWNRDGVPPRNLIFPYERHGHWTYPKPGFIQWSNKDE